MVAKGPLDNSGFSNKDDFPGKKVSFSFLIQKKSFFYKLRLVNKV